jgi:DNA repair photolyase
MAQSTIEWTESTWNPVTGCDDASPGCENCYARRMARRLEAMGAYNYRNGFQVTLQPQMLDRCPRICNPRRTSNRCMRIRVGASCWQRLPSRVNAAASRYWLLALPEPATAVAGIPKAWPVCENVVVVPDEGKARAEEQR